MASNKPKNESGKTPAWKAAQQKETKSKDSEAHLDSQQPKEGMVKIKMKTDYRDVAKAGKVWETDAAKAAELVGLDRAEYV